MRIERLELLHLRMPLVHFIETSFGRLVDHDSLIVRAESGGIVGYGEVPASATPLFTSETVHTAWHVIRDFLAPRLKGQEIAAPGPIAELFTFVRGHQMAKAGIEMAVVDLFGKAQNRPVWRILGGDRTEVPAGVSLGNEEAVGELLARVEEALSLGYQRIKLRIRPRSDLEVVAAVRRKFPTAPLAADAGAAYTLADLDHLQKLDDFELMMIEQPLGGDDVWTTRSQSRIRTPVCLGESSNPTTTPAGLRGGGVPHPQRLPGAGGRAVQREDDPQRRPGPQGAGLVRRDARDRHRPGPQHRAGLPAELHAARRHRRERPVLPRRRHRPARHGHGRSTILVPNSRALAIMSSRSG
jgi:O-succinylbenzoate synthase